MKEIKKLKEQEQKLFQRKCLVQKIFQTNLNKQINIKYNRQVSNSTQSIPTQ